MIFEFLNLTLKKYKKFMIKEQTHMLFIFHILGYFDIFLFLRRIIRKFNKII